MKKTAIVVSGLLLFACATKNKTVTETPPKIAEIASVKDLDASVVAKGKVTYTTNCAKCHKLYDAKDFKLDEWKPILDAMAHKASLTAEQKSQVWEYLSFENKTK